MSVAPTAPAPGRWLLVGALIGVGLCVAVPCASLLRESFRRGGVAWTFGNYHAVLGSGDTWRLLGTTLAFSACVAVLSGGVGFLFAWMAARTSMPLRRLMPVGVLLPYLIPPTLGAICWIFFLSPSNGIVNVLLAPVLGPRLFNIYSFPGMVFVESLYTFPLSFTFFYAALATLNPSLEEASMVSGAGAMRTFLRVTLPAMWPVIASVATVMFIIGFESFDVAWFLGYPAKIYTISIQVFLLTRYNYPPDIGSAAVFGVVALTAALLMVWAYRRITREQGRFVAITGKGYQTGALEIGSWGDAGAVAFWLIILITGVLPLLLLTGIAFEAIAWPFRLRGTADLRNFTWVFTDEQTRTALVNTVLLAVGGAFAVVAISFVIGWVIVRTRLRGRAVLDYLCFLPFGFPATVLAVGIITALIGTPFYNTLWILLLAYGLKFLPYSLRNVSNSLLQVHPELEEASYISGASLHTTMRRVLLPLCAPGLFSAWSLLFIVFGRQFSLPVMLSASGTEVLTIMLFQEFDAGEMGHVAAFGVLLVGFSLPCLAFAAWMSRGLRAL